MSTCDRAEALRDYAFDELPPAGRPEMERHLEVCDACAAELDQLRAATAALRLLPDREIPRRIAFVSDKVFEPSPLARFFAGFWNSGARLGFASACILAVALIVSAYHRQSAGPADPRAVDAAIAQAVAKVHAEDVRILAASEKRHDEEHKALMDAVNVLQDRLNTNTLLASDRIPPAPTEGQ